MNKMNKKTFGTKSYVCVYIYVYIYIWISWNKQKYLKKKKNEDIKIAITSYKQIWKLSHREYFKLHKIYYMHKT